MIKKENIRTQINQVDWNNIDQIIDFYEHNLIFFDNLSTNIQPDEFKEVIHIKITYAFALDSKKHFTKGERIINQVENLIKRIEDKNDFNEVNERFLFIKGMSFHRYKKYEDSQILFSQLKQIDPDNDLYKEWYDSNRKWILQKKLNVIGWIGVSLIFLSIILNRNNSISDLNYDKLDLLGMIMMFGGFWGTNIVDFIKRIK